MDDLRSEVSDLFAEFALAQLEEAEIALVERRIWTQARANCARAPWRDRRMNRDPETKPCGWRGCTAPRLRIPDKRGARLCAVHERARQERLERERQRSERRKAKSMNQTCLQGECHHLTRPCMTIRRLKGQLGGAPPDSVNAYMPPIAHPPAHFPPGLEPLISDDAPVMNAREKGEKGETIGSEALFPAEPQKVLESDQSMSVYGAVDNVVSGDGNDKEADDDLSRSRDAARIADRERAYPHSNGGDGASGYQALAGPSQEGQEGNGQTL